jgi:hypothetical protein
MSDELIAKYKLGAVPIFWYLEQAQYISITILTFNRFTSVVYPIKHTSVCDTYTIVFILHIQLWFGKWLKVALCVPWIIPLCLSAAHFIHNYDIVVTDYVSFV